MSDSTQKAANEAKQDDTERDVGVVKAMVHFSAPIEIDFLLKSVPVHRAMFPDTAIYIVFPGNTYDVISSHPRIGELGAIAGVHIQFTDIALDSTFLPVEEAGLRSLLESFELIFAQERGIANDMILRVSPFTIITNPMFFFVPVERGAKMVLSAFDAMPFGAGSYMLCSSYCHCLLRVVSLMGNTYADKKPADVYLQSLAFALFHNDKFFYASKGTPSGRYMQVCYDYERWEQFKTVLPVTGFVNFIGTGKGVEDMLAAADSVIGWLAENPPKENK